MIEASPQAFEVSVQDGLAEDVTLPLVLTSNAACQNIAFRVGTTMPSGSFSNSPSHGYVIGTNGRVDIKISFSVSPEITSYEYHEFTVPYSPVKSGDVDIEAVWRKPYQALVRELHIPLKFPNSKVDCQGAS